MSNIKSYSTLLILASLLLGCWARPRDDAALNEVTSQEATADDYSSNELLQQFAPVVGGAFYKQRHAYYGSPAPPQALPAQLWRSSFLRRFYNAYPELPVAPGGSNYYSNEVLPLSTYEIIEPEPMYY